MLQVWCRRDDRMVRRGCGEGMSGCRWNGARVSEGRVRRGPRAGPRRPGRTRRPGRGARGDRRHVVHGGHERPRPEQSVDASHGDSAEGKKTPRCSTVGSRAAARGQSKPVSTPSFDLLCLFPSTECAQ